MVSGAVATFTANATSQYPISYQWQKDGEPISGATSATLTVGNIQASSLGGYRVVATNLAGSTTSNIGALAFLLNSAGRLSNLSIRTNAGTGGDMLIAGVVVGGAGTSGAKPLLIRGVASRDAVLLVTLQPGSYTAQVSGVGNTTGVALRCAVTHHRVSRDMNIPATSTHLEHRQRYFSRYSDQPIGLESVSTRRQRQNQGGFAQFSRCK